MSLKKQDPIVLTPVSIRSIKVILFDSLVEEDSGFGFQHMEYEIAIDDIDGNTITFDRGELSQHLEQKEFDDFMKAMEKFRKKAEREILP